MPLRLPFPPLMPFVTEVIQDKSMLFLVEEQGHILIYGQLDQRLLRLRTCPQERTPLLLRMLMHVRSRLQRPLLHLPPYRLRYRQARM